MNKKEIGKFFVWMRNGTAFCTTWFLIIIVAYNSMFGFKTILTSNLVKMLVLIVGGVFLFTILFGRFIIKKWSFLKRLTCFMALFAIYECLGFYWLNYFRRTGTFLEWLIFVGIVAGLYICCIGIYQRYSKVKGEIYTQALQRYQHERI